MKKSSAFLVGLLMNAIRYWMLLVLALVLIVVGGLWWEPGRSIGLVILSVYLVICLVSALHNVYLMNYRSDDDPEFNEMMDKLTADPKDFLSGIMNAQEENKNLHGEALLALSDDDLFETVYLQNLDMAADAEDEDKELEQFSGARRTVYVLGLFDSEIQNGGLCQFFVNSSRAVAPYVMECLELVGAQEHRKLFEDFITANHIDVSDLSSFMVYSRRGFIKQTKRYDFDSFDDKYYELPALQDKVVAYIRASINEF